MKFYKDNNGKLYSFEDDITDEYINKNENLPNFNDLTEIIEQELQNFLNPPKTEQEIINIKIQEAQTYLDDTDFKMLVDYFSTLEETKKQELITKRAEARDYIRANEQ